MPLKRLTLAFAVAALSLAACSSAAPPQDGDSSGVQHAGGTPTAGHGPAYCPAVPAGLSPGFDIGAPMGEILVKDCDGHDVDLRQFCGSKGLWIYLGQAWCAHCVYVARQAEKIQETYAPRDLASINIVVENATKSVPTADDCKTWRDTFKLTNVVTLYDPNGATQKLWEHTGFTTMSAYVTSSRIIQDKTYTDDIPTIQSKIEAALGP